MSSMYYCLFENTAIDLEACKDKLKEPKEDLSEDEIYYRRTLIAICKEIANDYDEDE